MMTPIDSTPRGTGGAWAGRGASVVLMQDVADRRLDEPTAAHVLGEASAALAPGDRPRTPGQICRRLEDCLRRLFLESDAYVYLRDDAGDFVRVSESGAVWGAAPPVRFTTYEVEYLTSTLERGDTAVGRVGPAGDPFVSRLAWRMNLAWLLVTPIRHEGTTIGLQLLGGQHDTTPSASLRRGVDETARLAGLAIGSARLRIENERLERTRSEILSMVSHELRSPLHVILGYEGILRGGELGELNEDQHDALVRIGRNARQLAGLIENTLTAGRDDSRDRKAGMRQVRPCDVTIDIQEEMTSLYGDRDLEIRWRVPETLPSLYTDPDKLKVILRNLVANAVKFTDRGSVEISAQPEAGGLSITVSDTGVGIPASQLDAIFEEFRQVPSGDGTERGGVGLGLYIVRRMTEKLGGTVRVESTPGAGSTFTVWLPVRVDAVHAAA